MSETLGSRVGRIISGSVHALIDRLEDQAPEAMMEQAIREADGVVDDVRHELGKVSANRHLANQQHVALNAQHAALADQIEQALVAQREDLARAAIDRQLDIEAQLPVLESTLADQTRQESELQGYVAALLAKKREMQEALSSFRRSRATTAAAGSSPAAASDVAGRRMDRIGAAFDRMHERQTGLSVATRTSGLHQAGQLRELEDMVRQNQIAERLARLKADKA